MIRWLLAAIVALGLSASRVDAACTVSATGVSFGTYNVFNSSDTTSNGTVTYHCGNADHNIRIDLSAGTGTYATRTLKKGSEALTYNLYMDSVFSTVWGDGSGTTWEYQKSNPPNNTDVNLTVYGRITALQDVSAGSYSDTVVATVNF